MSLQNYTLSEGEFEVIRGNQAFDPDTGSSFVLPVIYNIDIPTGSAERTFAQGNVSVTVIDPNGEGTCKPRLVATASFSFKVLNDAAATPGAPFTSNDAVTDDIAALLDFFKALEYTLPSRGNVGPLGQ